MATREAKDNPYTLACNCRVHAAVRGRKWHDQGCNVTRWSRADPELPEQPSHGQVSRPLRTSRYCTDTSMLDTHVYQVQSNGGRWVVRNHTEATTTAAAAAAEATD